jgi:hypothetical protein
MWKMQQQQWSSSKEMPYLQRTIAVDIDHNEDSEEDARILNMGKTNPTKQFNLLKKRV